jgi:high-affinity iron transporter
MLLNIIIIVLRETLEASILISVMLSISKTNGIAISWLSLALLAGIVGGVLYAINLATISELLDYVGQEVTNAFILCLIYCALVIVCWGQYLASAMWLRVLPLCMGAGVALAITREGGELIVFYSGFMQGGASLVNAITSGFIGLTVGMSAGALCFYALISLSLYKAKMAHLVMLSLIAGGVLLQASLLFIQADWLSYNMPVWDSSNIMSETSIIGQIAYAVFGYEATPSIASVFSYVFAIVFIVGGLLMLANNNKQSITNNPEKYTES